MNDTEYFGNSDDPVMGGAQVPPALTSMEQALKRHLQRCQPDGAACKRFRGWRDYTPPPTPPSFHDFLSDDGSDEEGEEGSWSGDEVEDSAPAACTTSTYRGSILASCLLADKGSSPPVPPLSSTSPPSPGYWYSNGCSSDSPSNFHMASSHSHHHHQQQPRLANQTVECDGKSYIELGAMVPAVVPPQGSPPAVCPGWRRSRSQPYRQQRFAVLHATMLKLGRHRRLTDPRLHKSVLLYNTMRSIERELETEGTSLTAAFNPHQADSAAAGLTLDPPPPLSPAPTSIAGHHSPHVQHVPPGPSWAHDEPINWGSVLSIASQPDLLLAPPFELVASDEQVCAPGSGAANPAASGGCSAANPGASGGCSVVNSAGSSTGSVLMVL